MNQRRGLRWRSGAWIALAVAASAACGGTGGGGASAGSEGDGLVVGYTPSVSIGTLLLVADIEGFDDEAGVDMTLRQFATSPVEAEAVAAGELMIGGMGDTTIMGLQAADVDVDVISQLVDVSRQVEIVCSKQSGVEEPQDLEGVSIGYGFGGLAHNLVANFFEEYDVEETAVEQIDGTPDQLLTAYSQGEIDCISVWPPGLFAAKGQVDSVVLHNGVESFMEMNAGTHRIMGSHSNLFAARSLVEDRPEQLQAMLQALENAQQFVADKPNAAAKIVAEDFDVQQSEILKGFELLDFKLTIDEQLYQDMEDTANLFHDLGELPQPPPQDLEDWVEPSLLKEVDSALVTYEP